MHHQRHLPIRITADHPVISVVARAKVAFQAVAERLRRAGEDVSGLDAAVGGCGAADRRAADAALVGGAEGDFAVGDPAGAVGLGVGEGEGG